MDRDPIKSEMRLTTTNRRYCKSVGLLSKTREIGRQHLRRHFYANLFRQVGTAINGCNRGHI